MNTPSWPSKQGLADLKSRILYAIGIAQAAPLSDLDGIATRAAKDIAAAMTRSSTPKNPLAPGENTCPQVPPSDQAPLNHGTAEPYPDRRST